MSDAADDTTLSSPPNTQGRGRKQLLRQASAATASTMTVMDESEHARPDPVANSAHNDNDSRTPFTSNPNSLLRLQAVGGITATKQWQGRSVRILEADPADMRPETPVAPAVTTEYGASTEVFAVPTAATSVFNHSQGPGPRDFEPLRGPRNVSNFISISRRATIPFSSYPRISAFFQLFQAKPRITDTLCIDPHLKVPSSVLEAIGSPPLPENGAGSGAQNNPFAATGSTQNTRKNMSLQLIDGRMDVDIHLVPDDSVHSAYLRKSKSSARLRRKSSRSNSDGDDGPQPRRQARPSASSSRNMPVVPNPTRLHAKLVASHPTLFKAYPCIIRLNAPLPRPPLLLKASCKSSQPGTTTFTSDSPLTLYLPRSFYGPLTINIKTGNIDNHVWLSPCVQSVARTITEDSTSRGYFLGDLPDIEEEGSEEERDATDAIDEEDAGETPPPAPHRSEHRKHRSLLKKRGSGRGGAEDSSEWIGDKAEVHVENGKVRILFDDERLEGWANWCSRGWHLWPPRWSFGP
ncbi:hypothetical protein FA15DRAFT_670451 [Coprinopsis marcescibilis]|uniref:DUF7330 domain-containing protein n=1 Tax=Coprinopsis marcescibilis TaxID=230819 RepID=A0A5C3KSD2_COPMA|nr:hypothetical protein FA15DRAFT_670451 [Coprinopsis marcescibilis]